MADKSLQAPPPRAKRLKVLFVIGTLDVGGTEVQLVKLARGLDPQRFEVVVYCLSGLGPLAEELVAHGIRVETVGFRGFRGGVASLRDVPQVFVTLARFWRWMRSEAPDIVHCMLFQAYVIGGVVARLARVPVLIAGRRSLSNFKTGRPHYWLAERVVNMFTDLLIANSEAVRQDVLKRERQPPQKVIVIPNGLEIERYRHLFTAGLRDELGIASSTLVVVVVANFIHYKGHVYFLEAWANVLRGRPDSVALLVGEGPRRKAMEELAKRLGISGAVRFLGTRHDVPAVLAVSDVLVHPSLEEGFSNAIIEAMAAGKPVVATRVGGNPEAVDDGVTGLLVPPREPAALAAAVGRLLDDPDERRILGARAQGRAAERFALHRIVDEYQRLYERLAHVKGVAGAEDAPREGSAEKLASQEQMEGGQSDKQ